MPYSSATLWSFYYFFIVHAIMERLVVISLKGILNCVLMLHPSKKAFGNAASAFQSQKLVSV